MGCDYGIVKLYNCGVVAVFLDWLRLQFSNEYLQAIIHFEYCDYGKERKKYKNRVIHYLSGKLWFCQPSQDRFSIEFQETRNLMKEWNTIQRSVIKIFNIFKMVRDKMLNLAF